MAEESREVVAVPVVESNGFKRQIWLAAGSVVFTLLIQTSAIVWWAATVTNKIEFNREDIKQNCSEIEYLGEWIREVERSVPKRPS